MIEQLAKLALKAKAQAIHLSIRPVGKDCVQVLMNVESLPLPDDKEIKDEQTQRLRAALAQPLMVQGDIGEMDVFMVEELTKFAETYAPASAKFIKASNTDKLSKDIKDANKKPKTVPTPNQDKTKTDIAPDPVQEEVAENNSGLTNSDSL